MTSLLGVQLFAGKKCVLCYNQVVSVRERSPGTQEQTSHLDLQFAIKHEVMRSTHVVPGLHLNQTIPNLRTLILQACMIVMLSLKGDVCNTIEELPVDQIHQCTHTGI